ncbi:MAG: hypothetical protein HUJ73_05535, partial [Eubacterium sp.]|nr:hypothetical protein [Eubacterium sp.]
LAFDLHSEEVKNFARSAGITVPTYIQGAFVLSLSRWMGKERYAYKMVHNGRNVRAFEKIHGSFARGMFMLADPDETLSVRNYLTQLQDQYQETLDRDIVPITEMVKRYPEIETNIFLNYRGEIRNFLKLEGHEYEALPIGYYYKDVHVEHLLLIAIDEMADGSVMLSSSAAYFRRDTLEEILQTFEKTLKYILEEKTVGDVLKRIIGSEEEQK